MSVSDLQKLGLLKPENEWNGKGVGRSAAPLVSMLLGVISISSCVAMVLGDGSMWTWIGLIAFSAALACFVFVHVMAVGSPNEDKEEDPPDLPPDGR